MTCQDPYGPWVVKCPVNLLGLAIGSLRGHATAGEVEIYITAAEPAAVGPPHFYIGEYLGPDGTADAEAKMSTPLDQYGDSREGDDKVDLNVLGIQEPEHDDTLQKELGWPVTPEWTPRQACTEGSIGLLISGEPGINAAGIQHGADMRHGDCQPSLGSTTAGFEATCGGVACLADNANSDYGKQTNHEDTEAHVDEHKRYDTVGVFAGPFDGEYLAADSSNSGNACGDACSAALDDKVLDHCYAGSGHPTPPAAAAASHEHDLQKHMQEAATLVPAHLPRPPELTPGDDENVCIGTNTGGDTPSCINNSSQQQLTQHGRYDNGGNSCPVPIAPAAASWCECTAPTSEDSPKKSPDCDASMVELYTARLHELMAQGKINTMEATKMKTVVASVPLDAREHVAATLLSALGT